LLFCCYKGRESSFVSYFLFCKQREGKRRREAFLVFRATDRDPQRERDVEGFVYGFSATVERDEVSLFFCWN
jgi:hypothetical protein